jgi:hypothetical protein
MKLAATMAQVNTMTASSRFVSSQIDSVLGVFLTSAALVFVLLHGAVAQAEIPIPHTTMVVTGDHPISEGLWNALVEELHRSQAKEAEAMPVLSGDFDVLRGEDVVEGLVVETPLSVVIIGDCALQPSPRRYVEGALGWVRLVKGEIRPFVHVNCERIVQMLGPVALGMNQGRRNTVMAEAIARVIVHEWIHIATQSAGHAKNGVMQSEFELSDLLAYDEQMNPKHKSDHRRKKEAGF